MAETLSQLSLVSFIFAGISFVTAVALFFMFKIPSVIDYFTNRSAKKSVKQMTAAGGGNSKAAIFETSSTNRKRGKLTEKVGNPPDEKHNSLKRSKDLLSGSGSDGQRPETGLLSEDAKEITYLDPEEEITVELASETDILDEGATSVLDETIENVAANRPHVELTMIDEVILIHTNEVIR